VIGVQKPKKDVILYELEVAAYGQAMLVLAIGAVCAYRLYRTLQHERV